MTRRIAFFDFDGTITTKDTLLEFIKYSKGNMRYALGFLLNSPWLVAMKLKIISNQAAKERILSFFFRNVPLTDFQQQCDAFSRDIVPTLVRPKALEEFSRLKEMDAEIVIVSASPENWISHWATIQNAILLSTRLGTREKKGAQRLTGNIEGINCHGEEKVRRIREKYTLSDYQEIYTYGDTGGDKPMLALGTAAFFRPFR